MLNAASEACYISVMPKCCILIILDGLGDRAIPELGDATPLSAAHTPFMDLMAGRGCCGLYHAASPGQALPSENAHFSIFGYDEREFPGRGFLEAIGAGVSVAPGQTAILAHLSSVSRKGDLLYLEEKRPHINIEDACSLISTIESYESRQVNFRFHHTHGVDGILVADGAASRYVTDSDTMQPGGPLCAVRPWDSHKQDKNARLMADSLYEYLRQAHGTLDAHPINKERISQGKAPANAVTTQRAGIYSQAPTFSSRWGLPGLSISSGAVYWGLAKFLGMDVLKDSDSGDPGKDLQRRMDIAIEKSHEYGLIHVHTKTPDEAAHKKDPKLKKQVIESLDKGLERALGQHLDNPHILTVITSDLSTPSAGPLIHSGEAVPLLMHGLGVRRDNVAVFDEIACAQGALGQLRGKECLQMILNHQDMVKLRGIMDTPEDQLFWPGNREPFTIKNDLESKDE